MMVGPARQANSHMPCQLYLMITTLQVECAGSVEGGLLGMAWSPDQELVVFSTGTSSLLLMTHQLDTSGATEHELIPVIEIPMSSVEFGEGCSLVV